MGMLGVTMAYVMRACLGITLTQMVRPVMVNTESAAAAVKLNYCPAPEAPSHNPKSNRTAHVNEDYSDRFDWDEETQGWVLSAFYYGYIITHLPGGVLSQRFGGKHTMGLGILSTAIFTLMTPFVARMGSVQLTVLRFIEGLGEVRNLKVLVDTTARAGRVLGKHKKKKCLKNYAIRTHIPIII